MERMMQQMQLNDNEEFKDEEDAASQTADQLKYNEFCKVNLKSNEVSIYSAEGK